MSKLISRTKDTCNGMPRIAGTRITVSCIKSFYDGTYQSIELTSMAYHINIEKVKAAINFCRKNKI